MQQKSSISILLSIFLLFVVSTPSRALVSPSLTRGARRHQRQSSNGSSSTSTAIIYMQDVSGNTVLTPPPVPMTTKKEEDRIISRRFRDSQKDDDLWEVRLYNDQVNTHEWVAKCLVLVAGTTEWQAYQTTKLAHQEGQAHLGLYSHEMAETYVQGLREQGIVVEMFPTGDFQ